MQWKPLMRSWNTIKAWKCCGRLDWIWPGCWKKLKILRKPPTKFWRAVRTWKLYCPWISRQKDEFSDQPGCSPGESWTIPANGASCQVFHRLKCILVVETWNSVPSIPPPETWHSCQSNPPSEMWNLCPVFQQLKCKMNLKDSKTVNESNGFKIYFVKNNAKSSKVYKA